MRTIPTLAFGLLGAALLAGCAGGPAGDVAATVDATAISRAAFAARLATVTGNADVRVAIDTDDGARRRLEAGVLGHLVDAALVTAGAAQLGVEITAPELQAYLDELVRTELRGEPDGWQRFLDQRGYPEDEVRVQLAEDLRREAVEERLLPDPVVAPERVAEVYRDKYVGRPIIRHILLAEKPQAQRVLERLAAGEDFAALATQLSLDTQTARNGGDLGPHVEDAFVAPFEEAIENARDGQTVGPVQTPFGYHIIERRPPAELTEVRGGIKATLAEQLQDDAFAGWLAGLRQHAEVDVDPDIGHWDTVSATVLP